MTTQTMIERLTRAFHNALKNQRGHGIDRAFGGYREAIDGTTILNGCYDLDAAMRAALQALREPTDEMICAIWTAKITGTMEDFGGDRDALLKDSIKRSWAAGIRAALQENV